MYLDPQAWSRTAGFPKTRILRRFRSFRSDRCLITGLRARRSVLGEISPRRASDAGHPVAWCEAVSRCGYIATDRDRTRMHACLLKTGLETRELLCVSLPDQWTEQARVYRSTGFPRLDRTSQTPITPCRSFPHSWKRSFRGFQLVSDVTTCLRHRFIVRIALHSLVAVRPPRVPGRKESVRVRGPTRIIPDLPIGCIIVSCAVIPLSSPSRCFFFDFVQPIWKILSIRRLLSFEWIAGSIWVSMVGASFISAIGT